MCQRGGEAPSALWGANRDQGHKQPLGGGSEETVIPMDPKAIASSFESAPRNLRFASAVAGFAEVLRKSSLAATWKLGDIERIAAAASDERADQIEFTDLVRRAEKLSPGGTVAKVASPE